MKPPSPPAQPDVVLEPSHESSQFSGLIVVSVVASVTGILFLLAPAMVWPLRIFLIAIILLTLKYWGSVLVLVAVQLDLFFREPRRSEALQGMTGMLTVFLVVALLMFVNRNRELLKRAATQPFSAILVMIASAFRGDIAFDSGKAVREIPRMLGSIIRSIALLVACVFISRVLLSTLPNRRSLNDDLREWMMEKTSVLNSSLLIVGIIAAWIVCNEISWRQLTRDQGRLYLRSIFLTIHHADLRMIVRGRLKLRQKAARERKDLTSPPDGLKEKNFSGNSQ